MELTLSENIRKMRKQRKLTQEKLAEALGVTVGAVYKWETGLSRPELELIVEMADFFDTSVDVLLGYKMQDNRLESLSRRITELCRTMDPEALSEIEKTLAKYPNSFRFVYDSANIYLAFGASNNDQGQLKRALELLEQARMLLPQNDDPKINEAAICNNMATVYFKLGEQEKGLQLLKGHNAGGIFSSRIGTYLAILMDRPEEAVPFLSESLLAGVSNLVSTVAGYVFLFRSRKDWESALTILKWGLDLLTGIKTETSADVIDKTHAEMLATLAYVQARLGRPRESLSSLEEAAEKALRFDSTPDYSLNSLRFAEHTEQVLVYDILGAGACESSAMLLNLLGDEKLAAKWKELTGNE
ncbi:MAG: helix-turn-helix domain-containing protein [Erysipelotrichaceae bacterium]|nr:helix-turn-helix domain-containing protein [Erysipelotrichaceae bacterium]